MPTSRRWRRLHRRAWMLPVAGVILAPLVTWWPMLAHRFPGLGLPPYDPAPGIDFWGLQVLWLVVLGVGACWIGTQDRWLGVVIAMAAVVIFYRGATMEATHTILFTAGAGLLILMRRTPTAWRPRISAILAALGAFQVAYVLQQLAGYDLFWGPLFGGKLNPVVQPLGTLGTVDAAGSYIAITAPLMPLWCLPFAIFAVWTGKSFTALAALTIGLAVRYRKVNWTGALVMAMACFAVGWRVYAKGAAGLWSRAAGRVGIWGFGLHTWWHSDAVFGWGLGGWARRVPLEQLQQKFLPTKEFFREAHSEPLQWLCETGLVGAVLFALWLWSHREMFAVSPWGGSIAALGTSSLGFFPLHVVPLALVGLIVVGLGTASRVDHPALTEG